MAERAVAPSMRALAAVVAGFERLSARSARRQPPVRPVPRDVTVRVTDVRAEAEGVVSVAFDADVLPRWRPGAHLDVRLASGRLRQYSLCDPQGSYRIATRLIGAGSAEVHALTAGDTVTIHGPRNAFPFLELPAYLFVAGGIGITPIRPMVHAAMRAGADWRLIYTGRTLATMPFADELRALDPTRVSLLPDDEHGLPAAADLLTAAPPGAALYACGPPPLVTALRAAARGTGIRSIHSERFSPLPVVDGTAFEIELARSSRVVPVAADETALSALRALLPSLAYSCQQGYCGTCPVRVLEGAVEHRDRCLSPLERESAMAICVSRATGRLTLDL